MKHTVEIRITVDETYEIDDEDGRLDPEAEAMRRARDEYPDCEIEILSIEEAND